MKNIDGEYNTVAPAVNVGTLVKEDVTSYSLFFYTHILLKSMRSEDYALYALLIKMSSLYAAMHLNATCYIN